MDPLTEATAVPPVPPAAVTHVETVTYLDGTSSTGPAPQPRVNAAGSPANGAPVIAQPPQQPQPPLTASPKGGVPAAGPVPQSGAPSIGSTDPAYHPNWGPGDPAYVSSGGSYDPANPSHLSPTGPLAAGQPPFAAGQSPLAANQLPGGPAAVPSETVTYLDGTSVTGPIPQPKISPTGSPAIDPSLPRARHANFDPNRPYPDPYDPANPQVGDTSNPNSARHPNFAGAVETVQYADGTSATGRAPMPRVSPSGAKAVDTAKPADIPAVATPAISHGDHGRPPMDPRFAVYMETLYYADGTSATGPAPMPVVNAAGSPAVPAPSMPRSVAGLPGAPAAGSPVGANPTGGTPRTFGGTSPAGSVSQPGVNQPGMPGIKPGGPYPGGYDPGNPSHVSPTGAPAATGQPYPGQGVPQGAPAIPGSSALPGHGAIETVQYADGTSATGPAPQPRVNPAGSPAK